MTSSPVTLPEEMGEEKTEDLSLPAQGTPWARGPDYRDAFPAQVRVVGTKRSGRGFVVYYQEDGDTTQPALSVGLTRFLDMYAEAPDAADGADR